MLDTTHVFANSSTQNEYDGSTEDDTDLLNRSSPPTTTTNEQSSQDRTQRRQRDPYQERGNGIQGNLKRPYITDVSSRRPKCTARVETSPYHLKDQVLDLPNYR